MLTNGNAYPTKKKPKKQTFEIFLRTLYTEMAY